MTDGITTDHGSAGGWSSGELQDKAGQQAMGEGRGNYRRTSVTYWHRDLCARLLVLNKIH